MGKNVLVLVNADFFCKEPDRCKYLRPGSHLVPAARTELAIVREQSQTVS
jgi:hypothetical protein